MCNGHSTRVSQGGSIAVLRPTPRPTGSQREEDILLFFSNHFSTPGTSLEIQGWKHDEALARHWLVIQYVPEKTPAHGKTKPVLNRWPVAMAISPPLLHRRYRSRCILSLWP